MTPSRPSMTPTRVAPPAAHLLEHEADRAGKDVLRGGAANISQRATGGGSLDLSQSSGRPLDPGQRDMFEAQFGHDFRDVRIHADARAAEQARENNARAIASGNDIAFAPGEYAPETEGGKELLAHELAHTVQQSRGAAGAHHKPTEEKKQGIGAKAPEEPFTVVDGKGDEEEHFLFAADSATPEAAAVKKLQVLVKPHTGTMIVDIHGYAGPEGDSTYATNLAAHRAAAIERIILPLLPKGSQVELYSHGATKVWGDAARNRRAGVHIWEIPPLDLLGRRFTPIVPSLDASAPPSDLRPLDPHVFTLPKTNVDLGLHPQIQLADPKQPALDPFQLPPLQRPGAVMDWSALRDPFTSRGIQLGANDIETIEQNWNNAYMWALKLGLDPSTASLAANKLTSVGYDIQLGKDFPNLWDKVDLEDKKLGIKKSPNIPILTPETLGFLAKHVFHSKVDLRFTFP